MTSEPQGSQDHPIAPEAASKANDQASQANKDVLVGARIFTPLPPETKYEITCKTEKTSLDKFKDGAEIFGIFILLIYTVFTALMYCANKKAANAAQQAANVSSKTMIVDQRPWISANIAKIDLPDTVPPSPIFAPICPANVSRPSHITVARNPRFVLGSVADTSPAGEMEPETMLLYGSRLRAGKRSSISFLSPSPVSRV